MATVITDLRNEPTRAVLKPNFKRNKPKRRTLSELSAKEVIRLRERSNGVCERCDSQRATEKAHVERRHNHSTKPTAEDFIDLCKGCHVWADAGIEGRKWMLTFQRIVISKALAQ